MLKLYYVRRNVLTHKLYHFTCRSFIMIMITFTIAGFRIAKDLLVFMLFPFAIIFLNIAVSVLNNQSLAHYLIVEYGHRGSPRQLNILNEVLIARRS